MNEQELRELVRTAIASQAGVSADQLHQSPVAAVVRLHASHGRFGLPAGADLDGPCLIEPAVECDHCGYCKSYGH